MGVVNVTPDSFSDGGLFLDADAAVAHLEPITRRMTELTADPAAIDRILRRGAERANAIAAPIVEETRRIMGMIPQR